MKKLISGTCAVLMAATAYSQTAPFANTNAVSQSGDNNTADISQIAVGKHENQSTQIGHSNSVLVRQTYDFGQTTPYQQGDHNSATSIQGPTYDNRVVQTPVGAWNAAHATPTSGTYDVQITQTQYG